MTAETSCSPGREVELSATATEPEDSPRLLFTWNVSAGRFSGEGRKVTWDLSGLPEGTYTATVEINDGNQLTASDSTTVTIALCPICDRPPPPCPRVSVGCPSRVESTEQIIFVANVSGGEPDIKPTFTWSVSAGKIVSGQGTSKITVDASSIPRSQSITASVSAGGFHPACAGTASCTISDY